MKVPTCYGFNLTPRTILDIITLFDRCSGNVIETQSSVDIIDIF